ncbi:MAG: hypothetical protein H5T84_04355 [Thermoleophilia bacterium]|nr:hypothetical protein [Thermoleophilia bacterium]
MQDSFARLEQGAETKMLSDSLVQFVGRHAEYVARLWLADVRSSRSTAGYRTLDPLKLLEEGAAGLRLLGGWLEGEGTEEDVKTFYRRLGAQRREQGIALHEMLSALMLMKKQIWVFARSQGVWERPVDMYRVMELQARFAAFFDKAMYNAARGHEG